MASAKIMFYVTVTHVVKISKKYIQSKILLASFYTSLLTKLPKHIAKKRPQLHRAGWRLHLDNAQHHVENYVMQFLAKFNITALQPQSCSLWFLIPITKDKAPGHSIWDLWSSAEEKWGDSQGPDKDGLHHVSRNGRNTVRNAFN